MGWTRPPRDAWVEKDDAENFDFVSSPRTSTEDLLQNPGSLPPEGRDVVYFFQRDCSYMGPSSLRSYATHMAREVSIGLMFGAGLTVVGALAIAFSGPGLGPDGSLIGVGLSMGASLLGGIYSGHKNYGIRREAYPLYGESIPGKLARTDGHLTFFPQGQKECPVRLERYARADTVPGGEPPAYGFRAPGWAWWDEARPVVKKKLAFD